MSGQIFWLMGISGSGKTTLSTKLFQHLQAKNLKVELIDGDVVREFFDADYGYTKIDRIAVSKRIAFATYLLSKNDIHCIVANISPYHEIQDFIKTKLSPNYHQIYLKTDINHVKKRDVRGLYKKYDLGVEKNVIGLDEPFEEPKNPGLIINTGEIDQENSLKLLTNFVNKTLNI
jgi:adenylylsulfate kinase